MCFVRYAIKFTSGSVSVECPFVYLSTKHTAEQAAKLRDLLEQNAKLERDVKDHTQDMEKADHRCRSLARKVEGRRAAIDKCKRGGIAAAE